MQFVNVFRRGTCLSFSSSLSHSHLFIIGFILGTIPWYIGAIILLCVRTVDHREKPGYIACTIAACLAIIAVMIGASSDKWD